MTVIITGARELGAALLKLAEKQSAATRIAIGKAAHQLERDIKVAISLTSASGEEKRDAKGRFAKRGSTHSAPGEPPFLVSGDLRRSIQVEGPIPAGAGSWSAMVGPTVIYGRIQELGGQTGRGHSVTLPPRPYVAPTLAKSLPMIREIHRQAWKEAMG